MVTYNSRGFPLYSSAENMPAWDAAFNSQSNLLATAMDVSEAAAKAAWSVDTIAEIPDPGDSTRGQILYCAEDELVYVFDGTGWYAFGGKTPEFYGSRADSAVGTGGSPQNWVTTNESSRGLTFSSGVITFETVGRYQIDAAVIWEANGNGQRNLGVDGTDITVLGPVENVLFPNAFVEASQSFNTVIAVTAPGATARPYVTHNTGLGLDVYGTVSVRWVSA